VRAEKTVSEFRKWVAHQGTWSPYLKAKINPWGSLRISRTLKSRGVIPWELKHVRTQEREGRWASCARDYRKEVEAWLRLQRVRNLAPSTLVSLKAELLTFGGYLRKQRLTFGRVTYSEALGWLEGVRDSGLSTSTINHRLMVVKRFYAWGSVFTRTCSGIRSPRTCSTAAPTSFRSCSSWDTRTSNRRSATSR
jgi:hypothetical protein